MSAFTATLTLEGLYGRLDTSLPPQLQESLLEELQQKPGLSWVDATDLSKTLLFVGKDTAGQIWYLHGVHEILANELERFGARVVCQWRSMPKHHDWRIVMPPDHPSQPEMIEELCRRRRGAVQAPPGTGKTYVIAGVAALLGVPTLCLSYNNKPTRQIFDSLSRFTTIQPGLLDGSNELTKPVTVASVPKMLAMLKSEEGRQWWEAYQSYFELVIVDEAHHLASPGTIAILERLTGLKGVMAVSATYGRADQRGPILQAYGGPCWKTVELADVVGSKLVPLSVEVAEVPAKSYTEAKTHADKRKTQGISGVAAWQQARTRNEGASVLRMIRKDYIVQGSTGRNEIIARYVARMRRLGKTGVIIIKEIEHAEVLIQQIPDLVPLVKSDGKAFVKASSNAEAEVIIDRLKHREIDWIVSTTFDEAVDVPSLDCVVLAAGGKSWIKAWQRLRNTRSCDAMLRTGHYKKDRGHLLVLRDRAPMIEKHAADTLAEVRKYVASHPDNTMEVWDWNKE